MDAGSDDDTIYADGAGITILAGGGDDTVSASAARRPSRAAAARPHPDGRGERPRVRRPGADSIATGAGDDRIEAADGRRDRVRCGPAATPVVADRIDLLKGCETVTPPPPR